MENLERSWKVMVFQKPKRAWTLGISAFWFDNGNMLHLPLCLTWMPLFLHLLFVGLFPCLFFMAGFKRLLIQVIIDNHKPPCTRKLLKQIKYNYCTCRGYIEALTLSKLTFCENNITSILPVWFVSGGNFFYKVQFCENQLPSCWKHLLNETRAHVNDIRQLWR